jgi:DNA replication protein DnaC
MTAPSTTTTPRAVDVHALPAMLTALRLPSFHRHWPMLAERADTEGWPAARFLAALAEVEIAERETRRIRRHLVESRLPGGKTLATFASSPTRPSLSPPSTGWSITRPSSR